MSPTQPNYTQAQMDEALQQVRERRLLIDRYDQWLFGEFMPFVGQRVLEVGCGLGNLLQHLTDREKVVGIDLDHDSVITMRQQYADHNNVEVHQCDISAPEALDLQRYEFDTIISLNVFEHIDDDTQALRHLRALLAPGGSLILIVPAHTYLYGTMDSSIGHYRRYSKASMSEKLKATGFQPHIQRYFNALGALGWFVNGRIIRRRVPPTDQLKFFNVLVPLIVNVEKRIPPPFGISLLTVAK